MANGYYRLQIESAPNGEGDSNPVKTATWDIPFIEAFIDSKPSPSQVEDEVRGYSGAPQSPGIAKYAPEGSLKCRARPDYLGALLATAVKIPTTTAGTGSNTDLAGENCPSGAYMHDFVWPTGSVPQSSQVQFNPPNSTSPHWKATGVFADTFGLSFEDGDCMAAMAQHALYVVTQSDPSITPDFSGILKPFTQGSVTLTWLSGTATTEDFTLEFANNVTAIKSFGNASKFPDAVEYGDEGLPYRLTGTIPKRNLDVDDYNALKNQTAFAATILLESEEFITGAYPYKLIIKMSACQYTDWSPDSMKSARNQKATFNWEAKYNSTDSGIAQVQLVNDITTYNT